MHRPTMLPAQDRLSLVKTPRSRGTFRISNLPNRNIPSLPKWLADVTMLHAGSIPCGLSFGEGQASSTRVLNESNSGTKRAACTRAANMCSWLCGFVNMKKCLRNSREYVLAALVRVLHCMLRSATSANEDGRIPISFQFALAVGFHQYWQRHL